MHAFYFPWAVDAFKWKWDREGFRISAVIWFTEKQARQRKCFAVSKTIQQVLFLLTYFNLSKLVIHFCVTFDKNQIDYSFQAKLIVSTSTIFRVYTYFNVTPVAGIKLWYWFEAEVAFSRCCVNLFNCILHLWYLLDEKLSKPVHFFSYAPWEGR